MTFCATNALSFALDAATGCEPIRSAILAKAPRAALSATPSEVLRNEAMIPGPFNAAIANTSRATIVSEATFRHSRGRNDERDTSWARGLTCSGGRIDDFCRVRS